MEIMKIMKNTKNKLILILAMLLSLIFITAACSGFSAVAVEKVADTEKYAVTSNGGTVVQVGNLIYFVNGYKPITDIDGDNNKWGEVEKGGIYVAELTGGQDVPIKDDYYSQSGRGYNTYSVDNIEINEDVSGFVMETAEYEVDGESKEDKYIVNSRVVPKLVTGVNTGTVDGIYIIDGYIYYTTPNNLKNRRGAVQYELVDFMRTSLDGKTTQRLYTSKDTAAKPQFGYYYYQGATYLAVYESGLEDRPIYSVKAKGKKIEKERKIAIDVQSAVFAAKEVFYKNQDAAKDLDQNMVEDFIYYTVEDEKLQTNNKVVMVRPDGKEGNEILSGAQYQLDKVEKGFLFYSHTDRNNYYYTATDLKTERGLGQEPTLQLRYENGSGTAPAYANIFGMIHANYVSNQYELIFIGNDSLNNLNLVVAAETDTGKVTRLLTGKTVDIKAVDGNYIYYTEKSAETKEGGEVTQGVLKKLNYFEAEGSEEINFAPDKDINTAFANSVDIAAGFVFYVSTESNIAGYEETTADYIRFQRAFRAQAASKGVEWDINTVEENDLPQEDEDTEEQETAE